MPWKVSQKLKDQKWRMECLQDPIHGRTKYVKEKNIVHEKFF